MESSPIIGEIRSSDVERFYDKVKVNTKTGCWNWTAATRGGYDKQYGVFRFNGRTVYAHRFALYIHLQCDPGPSVDHLCHNPLCVNVEHLRGGSIADNNSNRRCIISEYCSNGHLRTEENVYVYPSTGKRRCKECNRINDRKRAKAKYAKEKALATHTSSTINNKLSFALAEEIRTKYASGMSQRQLAREYQVSQPLIGMIVRLQIWTQ